MWEHVARAAAADAGDADTLAEQLDSIQIVYCQTWQYDDAVARLAERLGADPRHRHYSGIGGTTTQQLVNATAERDARAASMDLALITSAEALATKRAYKKRGERWAVLVQARRQAPVPVGVAARSRSRSRTRCSRRGSRSRCSTTPGARSLGIGLDAYRAEIGEMLAPMTRDRGARIRTRGIRVERTRARDRRRRGPTTAWSAIRTRSTWSR